MQDTYYQSKIAVLQEKLKEQNFDKRIDELAEKYRDKKILLYGAGSAFIAICQLYNLSRLNIIGIADIRFANQGECCGYKAFCPFDIHELSPDIVLVTIPDYAQATDFFENDIFPKYGVFEYESIFPEINTDSNNTYIPSTLEYINKNMQGIPYFCNKLSFLSAMVNKAELDGLYLEFGVYNGSSINYIAELKKDKTIYGFDSFEGLPEDWEGSLKGKFKVDSIPEVKNNVKLIKGWFNETLPLFARENNEQVAFIHVDCDLYSSTKTIFNQLGSKIISGTIIFFDEYFNYEGWEQHEFKAFHEFCRQHSVKYEYLGMGRGRHSTQAAVRIIDRA
ncbi:MAG: hypothetical protein GX568_05595 [Candidatus Gastranaerophilales bacterium]|nr:hypothetical protein [Candidatus Gastranaerophilales bacterium]